LDKKTKNAEINANLHDEREKNENAHTFNAILHDIGGRQIAPEKI
jgi:hypothetical protein